MQQSDTQVSTKPYLLRAIYEWCVDQGYTPHLLVHAVAAAQIPREYVRDGQIVLNISPTASHGLVMDNHWIRFAARFNGVSRQIEVPVEAVGGLFARENGEGLSFPVEDMALGAQPGRPAPDETPPEPPSVPPPTGGGKPKLQIVK